MDPRPPLIVGIGGTTRPNSTSERALALALSYAAKQGMRTRMFGGPALVLEDYDPQVRTRSGNAAQLVDALRESAGVLIASPSYHGSVSGLIKNAIDFTEDMREDPRPYLSGRAVGMIVCAEGAQAMGSTLMALRSIVHALRGWPTPFAATINSSSKPFGPEGEVRDGAVLGHLELVAHQVAEFASKEALARHLNAGQ